MAKGKRKLQSIRFVIDKDGFLKIYVKGTEVADMVESYKISQVDPKTAHVTLDFVCRVEYGEAEE